jgi:hypothetical protein
LTDIVLCSDCFRDQGLHLDAERISIDENSPCPTCRSQTSMKLNKELIAALAHQFFVRGTLHRSEYGAAPRVQFNEHQSTSIRTSPWPETDLRKIEKAIGVGFFYYGPRLWMIGEVEPLKRLRDPTTRASVTGRIVTEYPAVVLLEGQAFYRLRTNPLRPDHFDEYDSPPIAQAASTRLDMAPKTCTSASMNVVSLRKTTST